MAGRGRPRADVYLTFLVLGSANVGKTSLLQCFTEGSFDACYITTVGIDYKPKLVKSQGRLVSLAIWDTAGQEKYHTLTKTFFQKADGVLLVYDVADADSFRALSSWVDEVAQKAPSGVQMVVVGNKSDLSDLREVKTEEGEAFAQRYGLPFLETSAKESINVDKAFNSLTDSIIDTRFPAPAPPPAPAPATAPAPAPGPAPATAAATAAGAGQQQQQQQHGSTTGAGGSTPPAAASNGASPSSVSLDLNAAAQQQPAGWGSTLWSWC